MKNVNILFLGASKRVSLIERFIRAAKETGVGLGLFSCEIKEGFYPISAYARVLEGPSFRSDSFEPWLANAIEDNGIGIVIPNMDSATVALSRFARTRGDSRGCWCVVSDYDLCKAMDDKISADEFFSRNSIPTPLNTPGRFPKILKPRYGFGAKGVRTVGSGDELDRACGADGDFMVQDFIKGRETTVDFYVSPSRGLMGYVLRDRIEVSDGEVMVCDTRPATGPEEELIERVASIKGWCGCITMQYIMDPEGHLYLIEINPRFGGGATGSIEAGLDMPRYILCEYLDYDFDRPERLRNIRMTRARRDFFYER